MAMKGMQYLVFCTKNGIRALHICRAHFAHYTEEHPLFGKYTRTFYKPMHVRGSLKEGLVIKDYDIHEK